MHTFRILMLAGALWSVPVPSNPAPVVPSNLADLTDTRVIGVLAGMNRTSMGNAGNIDSRLAGMPGPATAGTFNIVGPDRGTFPPATAAFPIPWIHLYEDVPELSSLNPSLQETASPPPDRVPVSVVLFAIGLAGLIGVARRLGSSGREVASMDKPVLSLPGTSLPWKIRRRRESAVKQPQPVAK